MILVSLKVTEIGAGHKHNSCLPHCHPERLEGNDDGLKVDYKVFQI